MAAYHNDIVDINLNSGTLHRSFLGRSLGEADILANRFGVRLFRDGEPVNAEDLTIEGFFMAPNGVNYMISETTYPGSTGKSGNTAYVQLPQDCYTVEGQFSLAIKLIGNGVTGTVRIVDGTVTRTGETGAVAPTTNIPTYAEVLAAYEEALALIDGVVRHDVDQSIDSTGKARARGNIDASNCSLELISEGKYKVVIV